MSCLRIFAILATLLSAQFVFIQEDVVVLAQQLPQEDDEIRLGVTIRNRDMLDRAPSCVHTFSRVELVNQNNAPLVIKSIDIAPERTVAVDKNGVEVEADVVYDYLGQQFVASRVTKDFVTLDPGQGAIIPLTFLPRFPPIKQEHEIFVRFSSEMPPWQQADREEWIGMGYARSNLGLMVDGDPEIFKVTTELLVETNYGMARVPFDANSVRQNAYGLPDTISFTIDAFQHRWVWPDAPFAAGNGYRIVHSIWNPFTAEDVHELYSDCYDLYLKHPNDENIADIDLQVQEVSISRPDILSVRIHPEKNPSIDADFAPSGAYHAIREWTEDGPLLIPPDDNQHYVATVCTEHGPPVPEVDDPEPRVKEDESEENLGIVRIRTDHETLIVAVFSQPSAPNATTYDWKVWRYHTVAEPQSETFKFEDNSTSLNGEIPDDDHTFYMLGGTSGHVSTTESLLLDGKGFTNATIIKVSVIFREADAEVVHDLGITAELSPANLDAHNWTVVIREEITAAFNLSLSWKNLQLPPNTTYEFHGLILVQGSATFRAPSSWIRALVFNTKMERNLIAVVPFVIRCAGGKLGVQKTTSAIPETLFILPDKQGRSIRASFFPNSVADLKAHYERFEPGKPLKSLKHAFLAISTVEAFKQKFSLKRLWLEEKNQRPIDQSLCSRFSLAHDDNNYIEEGKMDLVKVNKVTEEYFDAHFFGAIHVEYSFPLSTKRNETGGAGGTFLEECIMKYTTTPDSGVTSLPLYIYSGQIDVSVDLDRNGSLTDFGKAPVPSDHNNRVRSIVGLKEFVFWFQTSKAGSALRSLLSIKKTEDDEALLSRYLYGLSNSQFDPESSTLLPVLLNVGAMNPDEKEIFSLYVANFNPVPAYMRIDVGEVQGMSVVLGRDPTAGFDLISLAPPIQGHGLTFAGHPKLGLQQFLRSDATAKSLLSFAYHDAIRISQDAGSHHELLADLFAIQSHMEFHKNASPEGASLGCGELDPPQPYSKFIKGRKHPGPVIISTNSKSVRSLASCRDSTEDKDKGPLIVIPAGGVARFDVTVRSPPISFLDNDVSQFLSTGLVITSMNGIVTPVFIAFETPRGKLEVSPDDGFGAASKRGNRAMHVPTVTFAKKASFASSVVRIPPKSRLFDGIMVTDIIAPNTNNTDGGVPLYMTSSFNRPVELLEVSSCNPLFEVVLRNGTNPPVDPLLGVNIGKVRNIVPCTLPMKNNDSAGWGYSSFFACAVDWIRVRRDQPQACGSRLPDSQANSSEVRDTAKVDFAHANRAFIRAFFISAWSMGDGPYRGQRRSFDGIVSPALVDTVAKAWDIWRLGEESKLLRLSTSLRAVVRYNSSDTESSENDSEPQLLSLGMGNLTIGSTLNVPSLTGGTANKTIRDQEIITVKFPVTFVGAVSSKMIQVSNPTSTTVRVRLARPPPWEEFENYVGKDALKIPIMVRREFLTHHEPPYTQSGLAAKSIFEFVSHQWWDGRGSYFMSDFSGGLLRSHYNITVRAASGAIVSLLSPGLLANVAFIAGCGARCGIRDEIVKFDGPHDIRSTSFIGAAAAEGTILMGHQRTTADQKTEKDMRFMAAGAMLTGGKGPAPFCIPFFALKDEAEIPPHGKAELGPVLFRPPGRTKYMGCESEHITSRDPVCKANDFTGTLFLENSLTGLERVLLRGKAVWERVIFQDVPVEDDHDEIDAFSDIEMRNGRDALIFPGTAQFRPYGALAVIKQVAVINDGDVPVAFGAPFLLPVGKVSRNRIPQSPKFCTLGEFTLYPCSATDDKTIWLNPGENHSFFVKHDPRCTQSSLFVTVALEYKRDRDHGSFSTFTKGYTGQGFFQKTREELLVGYQMDAAGLASCIPSGGHVVFRFLDAIDKLGFERPEHKIFEGFGMFAILAFAMTYTCIILTITASWLILVRKLAWRWKTSSSFEKRLLEGAQRHDSVLQLDSNWLDTLRCLSRFDPSSQDLQTLAREQSRLVLLSQFRAHGVLPPLCLNTSGVFQRERNMLSRENVSKSGTSSGGSERIRTLSDAIFKSGRDCLAPSGGLGSFGAGWKTALSRGLINDFSLNRFEVDLLTEQLNRFRKENPSLVSEEESEELESSSSDGNEIDSTDVSYVGNPDTHDRGQSVSVLEQQEGKSESEESDDDLSEHDFIGKITGHEGTVPSDSNSVTSSLQEFDSYESETAEYITVMHKSKAGKKAQTPKTVTRSSSAPMGGAALAGTPRRTKSKQVQSAQPVLTKINVVQQSPATKRRVPKRTNGKLVAKAIPYEPKPSEVYGTKKELMVAEAAVPAESQEPVQPKPVLRPPPGLAPPPGFEGAAAVLSKQVCGAGAVAPPLLSNPMPASGLTSAQPPATPPKPPVIVPSDRVPSPISGDAIPLSTSVAITSQTRPDQNDPLGAVLVGRLPSSSLRHTSLVNQNPDDGFDIMDFLDNILNEGSTSGDISAPDQNAALPAQSGGGSNLSTPIVASVPLNPWAAAAPVEDESRPRAMAYGINFEEDTSERGTEGFLGDDLRMLTPVSILGGTQEEEGDKNKLSSSFYTNLLG